MFLTDLKVETDKDSELGYTLISPICGDISVSAPTAHERNNWLKKIAIAQKHIQDTERSLLQRQQSSKYMMIYKHFFLNISVIEKSMEYLYKMLLLQSSFSICRGEYFGNKLFHQIMQNRRESDPNQGFRIT